jgi:hypothetical protein
MTDACHFWMNWSINLVVAIGTVGAVIVALFGSGIQARLFPPKLVLTIDNPRGDATPVTVTAPNGESRREQARYYRLRVSNSKRWTKATQVRVQLLRLEEPGPDGGWQLKWAGQVPLRWTHQEIVPLEQTIGPNATCDLCSVVKDKWLELHPIILPANLADLARRRQPAYMRISVQVTSSEVDSDIRQFQISSDGQWKDGEVEMAQHLVVTTLPS